MPTRAAPRRMFDVHDLPDASRAIWIRYGGDIERITSEELEILERELTELTV